MIILTYDISDNKLRTRFSKFLEKYGYRLQYSVFEINNSKRILSLIQEEIKSRFSKCFSETDSVMIFDMSETCKITKYGYAKHQDEDFIIL